MVANVLLGLLPEGVLGQKCHKEESAPGVSRPWYSIAGHISESSSSFHTGLRYLERTEKIRIYLKGDTCHMSKASKP